MTKLSVNINKIATLRNARGGNMPDILKTAVDIQNFGADGITVHPRPDERHIRYDDVINLKPLIKTEFNIEGYPNKRFLELVKKVKPHQVTLVPDPPDAITSNAGWDTVKHQTFLQDIIAELKEEGIRTSIFVDTNPENIINAVTTNTDRVELYTEPYARIYPDDPAKAVEPYVEAANLAKKHGLKLNAGHDLSLENLKFFSQHIPFLAEVSIGHALICDALYYGLEETIALYKNQLVK
jgi:pyridoxine 5-phosphate synthase